jgi:hypothetical protein
LTALKSTRVRHLLFTASKDSLSTSDFQSLFNLPSLLSLDISDNPDPDTVQAASYRSFLSKNFDFFNLLSSDNKCKIENCRWSRSNIQEPLALSSVTLFPDTGRGFSKDGLKKLGLAIEKTPSLHHLKLRTLAHYIERGACEELSLGSSLRSLALAVNDGCDAQVARVFSRLSQLTALELCSESASDEILAAISRLASLKSVTFLPSDASGTKLSSLFPQLRLSEFDVMGLNFFNTSSSASFCSSLADLSTTLRSLALICCENLNLSDLSKAIPELKLLDCLALCDCRFWPALNADSTTALMSALAQTQIVDLRLANLVYDCSTFSALVSALPQLTNLHCFELSGCQFSDTPVPERCAVLWIRTELFTTLANCPKLHHLSASSNPPVQCDFVSLLPKTHLAHVSLRRSSLSDDQRAAITEACMKPDWMCCASFSSF